MSLTLAQIIDAATGNTEFAPINTTNEAYFSSLTSERLTDVLAMLASEILNRAATTHTHTGYAAESHTHTGYAASSHGHSIANISGLEALLLAAQADIDSKAQASALTAKADLVDGKVPSTQLPSFVDDVLDYSALANFPTTGEAGKIYVATDTNKTYRWSGSAYVEISASLALGETAATAYRGDRGKVAYDHSQDSSVHVTAAQKESWDSKAAGNHTHDYAASDHTHTPASIGAAAASHTHDYAASDHTHSGYAASTHTHTGYAASSHTHTASEVGAAAAAHTHSEYAASSHSHTGYADEDHTHTAADVGALPSSGGTVTGATTFNSDVTIKGKNYTQQMLPMDAGSYSIGASDNRYYSTYLRVNPNVSSDLRCKRDVETMDINALAAFVNKLSVVNYNYNDDKPEEAKRIGLIAQDVVAADPTIAKGCIEQDEKGFYSLRAADLVFPLIAAVQALSKRVEELESK